MKSLMLLTIFACNLNICYAETVDGPANIRLKPQGAVIASINNGVKLDAHGLKQGWFEVEIPVYVDKQSVSTDFSMLSANTKLFDADGNMIGKTLAATKFIPGQDETNSQLQGVIRGVTAKSNIRPETVLEPEIEKRLNGHRLSLESDWSQYMEAVGYESSKTYGDFDSFQANDQQALDPSPTPRIILYFYKKKLFALYHVRPIAYSKFVDEIPALDGHIHYLVSLTGKAKEDFDREFVTVLREAD